jgi:electron transfer flavoprotein alpha subunit
VTLRICRQRRAKSPNGVIPRIDPRRHEPDSEPAFIERLGTTTGLPRRDPHMDKRQRLRRELRLPRTAERSGSIERVSHMPAPVLVADDVPWVVVVSMPEEPWADAEREIMGAARRIADEIAGGVVLVRVGQGPVAADLGPLGADRVVALPSTGDPDRLAAHVVSTADRFKARHVLFGEGGADADIARRTALLLDVRPATSLQMISGETAISQKPGARTEVSRPMPKVMTLAAGRFDPCEAGIPREGRRVEVELGSMHEAIRDLGTIASSQVDAPLGEARFIVSAGDGVTDWTVFREAAEALGGTVAGSRQVVDAGHLPRHRQVGASGTLVEARCYLAFGISGAPQHLQGIQRCRYVVAVNTDLHAAMIKRADLAIIADAQKVMPELVRLARGSGDA